MRNESKIQLMCGYIPIRRGEKKYKSDVIFKNKHWL